MRVGGVRAGEALLVVLVKSTGGTCQSWRGAESGQRYDQPLATLPCGHRERALQGSACVSPLEGRACARSKGVRVRGK